MVNILKLNAEQTGEYKNIPLNSAEEENDGGGAPLGQMEFYKVDFTKKVPTWPT